MRWTRPLLPLVLMLLALPASAEAAKPTKAERKALQVKQHVAGLAEEDLLVIVRMAGPIGDRFGKENLKRAALGLILRPKQRSAKPAVAALFARGKKIVTAGQGLPKKPTIVLAGNRVILILPKAAKLVPKARKMEFRTLASLPRRKAKAAVDPDIVPLLNFRLGGPPKKLSLPKSGSNQLTCDTWRKQVLELQKAIEDIRERQAELGEPPEEGGGDEERFGGRAAQDDEEDSDEEIRDRLDAEADKLIDQQDELEALIARECDSNPPDDGSDPGDGGGTTDPGDGGGTTDPGGGGGTLPDYTEYVVGTGVRELAAAPANVGGFYYSNDVAGQDQLCHMPHTGPPTTCVNTPNATCTPDGVTVGPDGTVYGGCNGSIVKWEPPSATATEIPTGVASQVTDLDFGGDGAVWAVTANGRMVRVTTAGMVSDPIFLPSTFGNPQDIELGPDNKMYIAAADANRVWIFDPATYDPMNAMTFTQITFPNFSSPWALAFGADGKGYVGLRGTRRFGQFTLGGDPAPMVTAEMSTNPAFQVYGLAKGPNGLIYGTTYGGDSVVKVSPDLSFTFPLTRPSGSLPEKIVTTNGTGNPFAISLDGGGGAAAYWSGN